MIPKISDYFQLTVQEQIQLTKCVKDYSQHLALSNIIHRIWNAICSVFGQSDWQQVSRLLQNRTFTHVETKFSTPNTERETLKTRAKALSEFILRFLVTMDSPKKDFYFTAAELKSFKELPQGHLLEKAAYGNGKILGITPRVLLIHQLQAERASYRQDVDAFEEYIKHDPALQAAKKRVPKERVAIAEKGLETLISMRDNPFIEARELVVQSRELFKITDGIESVDDRLNKFSIRRLDESLDELSKAHKQFNKDTVDFKNFQQGLLLV